MISQSLPQLVNTVVTLVGVLASMLYLSVPLTVLALAMVGIMLLATKYLTGNSGKYFIKQQQELGKVNGYIEEMMNGQKVVKVFCHEQKSIEDFDRLNDALFEDSFRAQAYASVLGPIIGNIGNFLYAALALVGGVLLLIGVPNLSLSGKALDISILVPFLNMTKQFAGAIGQVSNQVNMVIMGLAGAVAGGIWALIPAFFKAKWNTNETLFTLMMNYIIILSLIHI